MSDDMKKQEALKKIHEYVANASALVDEAVKVADAAGVSFSVNFGGYGMGGTYYPPRKKGETLLHEGGTVEVPVPADTEDEDENDWYESGWQSSSSSC